MRKRRDIICEPRAFWDVVQITTDNPSGDRLLEGGSLLLEPRHWRNGEPCTIVLTHICYAGINYALREPGTALGQRHNGASWIAGAQILVSAPYRAHLSRKEHLITAYAPGPTEEPPMRYALASPYASGLFGISRWEFDFADGDMRIPEGTGLEFGLTGISHPTVAGGAVVLTPPQATFGIEEEWSVGGWSRRVMRVHERSAQPWAAVGGGDPFPGSPMPFPADAFAPFQVPAGAANQIFPAGQQFTQDAFKAQNANRGKLTSRITGFTVAIDQIAQDEELQASGDASFVGQPISPISMRCGVRARAAGGSGRWWWRDAPPLCLVTPTTTPACVQRLGEPIVLGKGDALRVEVWVPPLEVPPLPPGGEPIPGFERTPNYNFGVSLCGYAIVEG